MNEGEIRELLLKAQRSLNAARHLLAEGYPDFAASRSYYAMFYMAQAALLTKDIRRSKHSAVLAEFNREFVKNGNLPHEFFIWLRDGFDDRAEGDYGLGPVSEEQARAGIESARQFIAGLLLHLADIAQEKIGPGGKTTE